MKQSATRLLFIVCFCLSCSKDATKYKDLLNDKEIVYPGPVNNLKAFQGNLRVKLQWNPSPDPSITKYVIYWNNNDDSLTLKASNHNPLDSISTVITGISEYVQNFVLYTFDDLGNRSIGQSLSNTRIYGPLYMSSLINRILNSGKPPVIVSANTYKIFFSAVDTVLNTGTSISYINDQLQLTTININAKTDSAILNMAKAGTRVAIRSSYVPVRNAIDTFNVSYSDTLVLP